LDRIERKKQSRRGPLSTPLADRDCPGRITQMPRVPYIEKAAAAPDVQKLYESFESQFGIGVPNVVKALSNSPGLATKVFPLANYFMNQSALDPRVRELAVLMLMKRCNCDTASFAISILPSAAA
jgi:hypothetical protein